MTNRDEAPAPLKLLLVEDNPSVAQLVIEVVREEEPDAVEVVHVSRLADALAALEGDDFDAILLCLSLPDAFGLETVQRIRANSPHVPIVVLSGTDERIAIDAVREGAQDFVRKTDVAGAGLIGSVRYAIGRHARMHRIAFFDTLTHLPNRMLFRDRATQAILQARRCGDVFAVLFLDLDDFASVNDVLGHEAGDVVLQGVARRMRGVLRSADIAARYGGDEFAVLLGSLRRPDEAGLVAIKLRAAVAQPQTIGGNEVVVGASIGIASFPRDGEDVDALVQYADQAMYAEKQRGKTWLGGGVPNG